MEDNHYTMPIPAQRDVDIAHNLSFKLQQSTNCTAGVLCNGTSSSPNYHWSWTSASVLHIAFPLMIGWGVLTGFINICVLRRHHVKGTNESYLIGFCISSILLLCCGGLLRIEDYFGHMNECQYMYGYLCTFNSWFWYATLWILLIMVLERCLILTQNRTKSLCTPCQASAVIIIIYMVTFLSALPQFWEYEVTETFEYGTNKTLVLAQISAAADMPEYKIMYFWYRSSATLFFPFPTLLVMCVILCKQMHKSNTQRNRLSLRYNSGNSINRKVAEEVHITRLYVVLIILYLLLTGPLVVLELCDKFIAEYFLNNDALYKGVSDIFDFAFYFYFAIEFLLMCSYSDRFRRSLCKCCHCCCVKKKTRSKKTKSDAGYMPAMNGRSSSRPDTKYYIN